jgi:hydroxyethylthiazole kinase-like uncharacterized protein yjeF
MSSVIDLDDEALRAWPLPLPAEDGDKEERGRVLVIAGSDQMPGAAVLAGEAALRAGAGKLVVGTPARIAPWVAQRLPEARVVAIDEDADGAVRAEAVEHFAAMLPKTAAVLVGPGMQPEGAVGRFVLALLPRLPTTPLLLDAAAMDALRQAPSLLPLRQPVVLTPHAGEMAHLTGHPKDAIGDEPAVVAERAARQWGATVALKGAETWIAQPDGRRWRHTRGNVGLATSGSGDVLAGLIVGLLARGAPPEQAAAWGVSLHARAGERLAARLGPLGYLARELAGEVPRLMAELMP